jgi:hypothetical protein
VADPEGIITGGHDNTTARTVAIREGEPVNRQALAAMVRQIIANNRPPPGRGERLQERRRRASLRGANHVVACDDT